MRECNLDTVLDLVGDRTRRQAIRHLRHEVNGNTSIDDLVETMRDGGSATDGETIDREFLAIQLYHTHLPKLADYGVVEFDPERRAVRYQADEQIERILDSLPGAQSVARP